MRLVENPRFDCTVLCRRVLFAVIIIGFDLKYFTVKVTRKLKFLYIASYRNGRQNVKKQNVFSLKTEIYLSVCGPRKQRKN